MKYYVTNNNNIWATQETGGPRATGAEECRCPPGYRGFSCEECAAGFYRDTRATCARCPCNDHEQTCARAESGRVECTCRDGWGGAYCDTRGEWTDACFASNLGVMCSLLCLVL